MWPVDAMVAGTLVGWFVLSLVANLGYDRRLRGIRARDPFGLLPSWWVFAPRPLEHDPVVAYRDVLAEGQVTDWTELPPTPRGRLTAVWNPTKRLERATVDVCAAVTAAAARGRAKQVLVQLPYLLLLDHVCAQPRPPQAVRRQFRIARVRSGAAGGDGPAASVVFESAYHRFTPHDP